MEELIQAFNWVVHPLAGLALAFFASVIFSRRSLAWPPLALVSGLLILLAVLGADWVLHAASGMLLGFFGNRAFHRWQEHVPVLLVGLVAAVLFMVIEATWLIFPLSVMALLWLARVLFAGQGHAHAPLLPAPEFALPNQAGGVAVGGFGDAQREREPVSRGQPEERKPLQKTQAPLSQDTALAAFLHDRRLPGDVRARLAALDLRTQEALTHLEGLGQQATEGAYLARAARDEYAPTAVLAYLKLPRTLADTQPLEEGKTGHDLLNEQLDLLLDAVQDILSTALRAGGQELLTHQRFLKEKFRKINEDLKV